MPRHILIPLIVAFTQLMSTLDMTIVTTALPAMAASLGESPLHLNVAITSNLLSFAVFVTLSGWLADRYGARTILITAMAVFTTGSIACGFADTVAEIVVARILQGAGGAMMTPVGRLIVLRTVPKSRFVDAMAYLSIPAQLGPIFGPPLGGFIATYGSWRWIFFINIPLGIVGMLLAWRFIENIREEERLPLDIVGFFLLAVGLAGLVFGFETAARGLLPTWIGLGFLAFGAAATAVYVMHARRTPHRIIDISLLKFATFRAALLGSAMLRLGVGALSFLLPVMLQVGFGFSAFMSGLFTFVGGIGAIAMKFAVPPVLGRFGFRRVLIVDAALIGVFYVIYGFFTPSTSHLWILGVLLIGGFFRSLQFTAVNTLAFADVPAQQMSRATTFTAVGQQVAVSFGVGLAAVVLHLTVEWRGGNPLLQADDFLPAFVSIALVSFLSIFSFTPLSPQAGDEISRRRIGPPQS